MSNKHPPMDAHTNPFSSGPGGREPQPGQITGLMVLGFMIAFFAIIVGVNVFMAHAAISDLRRRRNRQFLSRRANVRARRRDGEGAGCSALAG